MVRIQEGVEHCRIYWYGCQTFSCLLHNSGKRSEEQSALEKASFLQSIITSLVPMIPVIASVVMFIAYILTGNDLNVAEVTNQLFWLLSLSCNRRYVTLPSKQVTLILFMKFLFLHTCKEHLFFFQMIPKIPEAPDFYENGKSYIFYL